MPSDARRRAALAALLLALAGACDAGSPPEEPAAPSEPAPFNLILITIDTLRADALGAYGQALPTSPNLDALARQGVLFEQCTTSAPYTLPSHSSILTGKQPYSHGVRANAGYVLPAENVTLAEVMAGLGYRTAGEIAAPVIGRRTFLNQGFEHYRDLESLDIERVRVRLPDGEERLLVERGARDITDHGLRFIASSARKPFFLWLHYFDPHVPYGPSVEYVRLIPQSRYHAEVRYVDEQIGRVMRMLRDAGIADRTLVVVTSDHGESLGQHDEATHAFFVYESTLRVPLLFWAPRLLQPRRVETLVRTIDIAPTVLDLLGLPPLAGIEGVSLRPLLEGRRPRAPVTGYAESITPLQLFNSSILRSVREGDWKYIHKLEPELYAIRSDPDELENLASREPQVVEALRGRLRRLLEEAPPLAASATSEVDPVTQAHLEALGYVVAAPVPEIDELGSLEVTAPDPAALAKDMRAHAQGLGRNLSGRYDEAEAIFRELWRKHPRATPVLGGLIQSLENQGKHDELEPLLKAGVALGSAPLEFHVKLAKLRFEAGARDEAFALLRDALGREPCAVVPRVTLSNLLHQAGRYRQQIGTLEEGVSRCPDASDLRNDLAFALASTPDASLRDGARALDLAKEAVSQAEGNPSYLDTLACALAETGDFEGGAVAARKAVRLVEASELAEEVVAVFRGHLEGIESGLPCRKGGDGA